MRGSKGSEEETRLQDRVGTVPDLRHHFRRCLVWVQLRIRPTRGSDEVDLGFGY
jgi:hypothetical protein